MKRDVKKSSLNWAAALAIGIFAFLILMKGKKQGATAYFWGTCVALPAFFLAYRAVTRCAVGECPACDMYIGGLSTGRNEAVFCPYCGQFAEGENGELWVASDERLMDWPGFTVELPHQVRWPDGCCVCGKPATRTTEIELVETRDANIVKDLAVRTVTLGIAKLVETKKFSVRVPHCQDHRDGAALYAAAQPDQIMPAIGFRSRGYMRRFCELNHTQSRPRQRIG
ncbi:MAG: hypothetical protein U0271_08640 [Polyangiaceae bacterium]